MPTAANRPNVILMMADDLGWGDVAYNGHPRIKTPHLDRMAQNGIRFDRFYSASAVCSPTRASCLTGRNPHRTGVFNANDGILRPEEVTIFEVLKEKGYATGLFGKWHLGTFSDEVTDGNRGGSRHPELVNLPSEHGVDLYFATESKVPTCDPMKLAEGKRPGDTWDYLKPGEPYTGYGTYYWSNCTGRNEIVTENLAGDDSRVTMDRAIPFIEGAVAADQPFLAVIWFHAPHRPCVAAPEFHDMYADQPFEERNYYGCITGMDRQVGRLRARLKALGVARDTMLWFCSDNGPEGGPGVTGGFRERKRSLHDGGVRVPGLLVWPDRAQAGRTEPTAVVTSDYLPTVMDALDIPAERIPYRLDGVSLMDLIAGDPFERDRPICFQYRMQANCSTDRHKYYQKAGGDPELYDMLADPYEAHDIAGDHPELVQELRKQFLAWQADTKGSFEGDEYGTSSRERVRQDWDDVLGSPAAQ
jgi:arylsulfatase A-like enzyme